VTSIAELNALDARAFVDAVGFAFESSPWIARETWERRPFGSLGDLHAALVETVRRAPEERRIALIAAHPDLAGRLSREGRLAPASAGEQRAAGLDRLTSAEIARFERLNAAYRRRFGFPFVICARKQSKESILDEMARRTRNSRDEEIAAALREIAQIALLRLRDTVHDS
jgi:2-oxo-4-hydroxy-4-carboxy-5-ureidoimidazoline decarboxylase